VISIVLEGDVLVADVGAGGGAHCIVVGGGTLVEVLGAGGASASRGTGGCAIALAAEESEIGDDNFSGGFLLAFLILPFPSLESALEIGLATFLEEFLNYFGLFAPDYEPMPFRALLALAIAVFVRFVRGNGKIGDRLAAGSVADFRIAAQSADEDYFIDGHLWAPVRGGGGVRDPSSQFS
jgi:hypothetical protein